MDEDPHAREMTGVVDERRDPHPKQRRECNGAQGYVKGGMQRRCSGAADGALGRLEGVNRKKASRRSLRFSCQKREAASRRAESY